MNKTDAINAVALRMSSLIEGVSEMISDWVKPNPVNVIILIGTGDVVQYGANVERAVGKQMLIDLFGRWALDMKPYMPDDLLPADTKRIVFLINRLESFDKGSAEYNDAKRQIVEYAARLESEAKKN